MRVFALLSGGMVLIVGMTYVFLSGSIPQQARAVLGIPNTESQRPSQASEQTKTAPKPPEKRNGHARKSRLEPADAEISMVDWRTLPEIPEPQHPKRPAFPEPRNFASGMLRSDVERLYGTPTLSTIQTRSGRLLQRYIYVSPEKSSTTMAIIEDGRVVSALSMPN